MNSWAPAMVENYIRRVTVDPWRVVEAQHISSSRDLVDSLEEHDVLEELIEQSKPAIDKNKHYLLFSPFRYPPLNYGSRFGRTNEPSLWYGSVELDTAFSEVAYYRLKFFHDTAADLEYIEIPMTAFQSHIRTEKGLYLTRDPFCVCQEELADKTNYQYTQGLGTVLREAGVEVFLYYSARAATKKNNVAAFTPDVFSDKEGRYIIAQQNWLCIANEQHIEFTRLELLKKERLIYSQANFES